MEGWKDGKVGNLTRVAAVVHRASQPHEKTPRAAGGPLGVGGWLVGLVGQGHMLRASEACRWAAMAFWRASRSNIGRP